MSVPFNPDKDAFREVHLSTPALEQPPDIIILEGDRYGIKMVALDLRTGLTYAFTSGMGYKPEVSVIGGQRSYTLDGEAATNLRDILWKRAHEERG